MNREAVKLLGQRNALKQYFDKQSKQENFELSKSVSSKYIKKTNREKTLEDFNKEKKDLLKQSVLAYGTTDQSKWTKQQQDEYQKNLDALNEHYYEEMQEARKKDEKDKQTWYKSVGNVIDDVTKRNMDTVYTMMGPFAMLIKPFEEFFGGTIFGGIKNLFTGVGNLFKKATKKKPSESDVLKMGTMGLGFLYLGKLLGGGGDKDEQKKGIFAKLGDVLGIGKGKGLNGGVGLLGKAGKGLKYIGGGSLATGAGIMTAVGAIIAGAVWGVIDGIKASANKDMKGNKFTKFIGGFFAGASNGIVDMFKNMGKWALIGAGTGATIGLAGAGIGAIPGALIGGLIGVAVGALLNVVGAENISSSLSVIGTWFKEKALKPYLNFFKDFYLELFNVKKFIEIWKGEGSIVKKIGKTLGTAIYTIALLPIRQFTVWIDMFKGTTFAKKIFSKDTWKAMGTSIKNFFGKVFSKDTWKVISGKLLGVLGKVFNNLLKVAGFADKVIGYVKEFFGGFFEGAMSILKDTKDWFDNTIFRKFINNLFTNISNKVNDFFHENPVKKFLNNILKPIRQFFNKIGDFFGFISNLVSNPLELVRMFKSEEGFSSEFDIYHTQQQTERDKATIKEYQSRKIRDLLREYGYRGDWIGDESIQAQADFIKTHSIDKNFATKLQAIRSATIEDVDDAIIKSDGTIIRTSVDDNIIATKNVPRNIDDIRSQSTKNIGNEFASVNYTNKVEDKLNKMIDLLAQIVKKDLVVNLPPSTRSDIELLVNGIM